jgi:hypothetical protein
MTPDLEAQSGDLGSNDTLVEADDTDGEAFVTYDIASYPADYTLGVIEAMWAAGDIVVPSFQRNFVWTIKQSSLLIESLLMGLPVPQAFFFIEAENKNLVIDGLQRIMSIVCFFSGFFGEETYQGKKTVFRLTGLSEKSPYAGKTFAELTESERRKLKNSVLRVINVRQIGPRDDDTSAYHIFERLNTGGTPLTAQEIRNCVFHGPMVDLLTQLNLDPSWRRILGKGPLDKHQKDVELLLRVFAFAYESEKYEKPMKEFLNQAMTKYRLAQGPVVDSFRHDFPTVCRQVLAALGDKPFHPKGRVNASALDSVLGLLVANRSRFPTDLNERFRRLLADPCFSETLSVSTSDVSVVRQRVATVAAHLF